MAIVVAVGTCLTLAKFAAFWFTSSNAILTDALESIVNVIAGLFTLYSVYLSSRPRDRNHPYGHGKIEYFAAGFEGGLIFLAGGAMLVKAVVDLLSPQPLQGLAEGLSLTAVAGVGNLIMGLVLLRQGKAMRSVALKAEGRHLLTDVWTSAGVLAGLGLVLLTEVWWLDNALAIALALYILYSGAKLLRTAVAGLMDETDFKLLQQLANGLKPHRRAAWIDLHNLRVQQFGDTYHIDCHLTLPWYYDLRQVREEVKALEEAFEEVLAGPVEASIRPDPCIPEACATCRVQNCPFRAEAFRHDPAWLPERLAANLKLVRQLEKAP